MNFRIIIIPVLLATTLFAATEMWRYERNTQPHGAMVQQIVSDGKGGCATSWMDTNENFYVVWLDKKGKVKYEQKLTMIPFPFGGLGPIADCSPKRLLYFTFVVVVEVTKKGDVYVTGALDGLLMSSPMLFPLPRQKLVDKKGFFAVNADTNSIYHAVVRYSNK